MSSSLFPDAKLARIKVRAAVVGMRWPIACLVALSVVAEKWV